MTVIANTTKTILISTDLSELRVAGRRDADDGDKKHGSIWRCLYRAAVAVRRAGGPSADTLGAAAVTVHRAGGASVEAGVRAFFTY